MTDAELDAIEARASAARPGPWRPVWAKHRPTKMEGIETESGTCVMGDGAPAHWSDGDFIIAARTDVPALVAEVRKLRAVLRLVEWEGSVHDEAACPCCRELRYQYDERGRETDVAKHAPGCELAEALK